MENCVHSEKIDLTTFVMGLSQILEVRLMEPGLWVNLGLWVRSILSRSAFLLSSYFIGAFSTVHFLISPTGSNKYHVMRHIAPIIAL